MSKQEKQNINPPQHQAKPGDESQMMPEPQSEPAPEGKKLKGKVAVITGGDSGIGRAVAYLFAQEGADIAISYLSEHEDARDVQKHVEGVYHRKCLLFAGDLSKEENCREFIHKVVEKWGHIDIIVNNIATQTIQEKLENITSQLLLETFSTNIFSYFWITQAALPHMKKGSAIINSSSVTAYRGSPHLIDYASTKGAIVGFTRSLAGNLAKKGIRVNGVAPGPIWTPLIPSSFDEKETAQFGSDVLMGRPGEPNEVAPSYLFLACEDSSYMTGQFLHPNGGSILNT
ncbi:MAG: short-chain dehydrogenase [Cytophagaceae bacterium]|nr:short-chain dehydrogenase [Cytophagaceae bacterium]